MHLFHDNIAYLIYAGLTGLYAFQVWKIIQVNTEALDGTVAEIQHYSFKQVAVLDLAYMITFGTEIAVVSMLPLFYIDTFGVEPVMAGILAGIYPLINLFARPAGGWISDRIGRKVTLSIVTAGIASSFLLLGQVTVDWSLWLVVCATILGGIFSKAGFRSSLCHRSLDQTQNDGTDCWYGGRLWQCWRPDFSSLCCRLFRRPRFFTFIACTAGLVFFVVIFFA